MLEINKQIVQTLAGILKEIKYSFYPSLTHFSLFIYPISSDKVYVQYLRHLKAILKFVLINSKVHLNMSTSR